MFERMKAGWRLAKDGNMKDGDLAKVKVDGIEVLIIKDGDNYFSTSYLCTHEDV